MPNYPTVGATGWAPGLLAFIDASAGRLANLGQVTNRNFDLTALTPILDDPQFVAPALTIPTGYTNNETVEPSVLYDASAPFLGYEYVLCISPYPASDVTKENPCLWVSHNAVTWIPVVFSGGVGTVTPGYGGTATPVIASGAQGDGNNSDSFLCRGPDGTYYILWNQFLIATGSGGTGTGGNDWATKITKASSLAGPWSTPVTITATVKATSRPSSPSMFWDGSIWHLYCVELASASSTTLMHYTNTSADPTTGTWTLQTAPAASLPSAYSTQVWWHLNAYYVAGQHVLVIQDSKSGTSGGGNIWFVASADGGTTWTVPNDPQLAGRNDLYRSAVIFTQDGGVDVFLGRLSGLWELRRLRMGMNGPPVYRYGGMDRNGIPINAKAVAAARVPVAPYQFGDVPNRADSSTSPGVADSGQTLTVSTGVVGISSKQFYATTTSNSRAATTTTGCADGVTSGEFSATDTNQFYLLTRYADANNYIRFGNNAGSTAYVIHNIVAGAQAQGVTLTGIVPAAGDVITLVHIGSTINVYRNGRMVWQVTGWTSNATNSGVGVQFNSSVGRIRNVTQRSLVNGA